MPGASLLAVLTVLVLLALLALFDLVQSFLIELLQSLIECPVHTALNIVPFFNGLQLMLFALAFLGVGAKFHTDFLVAPDILQPESGHLTSHAWILHISKSSLNVLQTQWCLLRSR